MLHIPEIEGWTAARVERLKVLWMEGHSGASIAAELGGGLTRNAVIGKVHRLKLPPRMKSTSRVYAKPQNGNKGQPKAAAIRHRVEMQQAPKVNALPVSDELPDVTHLLGIMELNEHTCRWPFGDPLDKEHFGFCGVSAIEGSPYCAKHARRSVKVLA